MKIIFRVLICYKDLYNQSIIELFQQKGLIFILSNQLNILYCHNFF